MNLTVSGHGISVTDSMRNACEKQHKKLSDSFPCISQEVTFSQEGHLFKVHSEYKTDHNLHAASASHDDLYQALAKISDKLSRQLRDSKPRH